MQISDDSGEIYTYERTLKAALSLTNNLKNHYGVHQGDRVILFMDHHHYLLPTWLGCALAGTILCPFAFTHEVFKEEVAALITQIKPAMLIASEDTNIGIFEEIFRDLKLNIPIVVYNSKVKRHNDLKPLLECEVNIDDVTLPHVADPNTEPFALALSSATTGKCKLITISHRQMLTFM